jgi:hypothetical protein
MYHKTEPIIMVKRGLKETIEGLKTKDWTKRLNLI